MLEMKNNKGKVLYVWFDAPIGYISATKIWAKKNNKNWEHAIAEQLFKQILLKIAILVIEKTMTYNKMKQYHNRVVFCLLYGPFVFTVCNIKFRSSYAHIIR